MNKVWRQVALVCIALTTIYAMGGFIFYQRQSCLILTQELRPLTNYHFPRPNTLDKGKSDHNPPGNPFMEFTPSVAVNLQKPIAVSDLILLGTLSGPNPKAVVAEKNNPGITHILGTGESWLGERIVSIGKGSIVIWKNDQKVIVQTTP